MCSCWLPNIKPKQTPNFTLHVLFQFRYAITKCKKCNSKIRSISDKARCLEIQIDKINFGLRKIRLNICTHCFAYILPLIWLLFIHVLGFHCMNIEIDISMKGGFKFVSFGNVFKTFFFRSFSTEFGKVFRWKIIWDAKCWNEIK